MPTAITDLNAAAKDVARALLSNTDVDQFKPHEDWNDLGLLIRSLELKGLFLMINSATKDGRVRRTASFHKDTGYGYPCAGGSDWGFFPTIGEAVLRAAHEAVTKPRV